MDKLFKSLKTSKRRLSQQFKMATGNTDTTTDATFDIAYRRFSDVENNLKALRQQCESLINNVETWCDTNRRLADELLRFTQKSDIHTEDMNTYKEAVLNLHTALQAEYDFTRRGIICVLRAHIIVRIERLLKDDYGDVEKVVKIRKNIIMDYDSHRSKCSTFERKGDSTNAERFRMKMDHDHEMLKEHTQYLETRFEELIAVGAALLSSETATLIACEMYLVKRQHEAMETISASFPNGSIYPILQSIDDLTSRVKNGENVEMSYIAPDIVVPAFPFLELPAFSEFNPALYQDGRLYEKHAFDEASTASMYTQPLPPQRPPIPGMVSSSQKCVRALYPLDGMNPGELSFREGDTIEVIHEDPSGWWEGRLNGIIGRFPSNYTTASSFLS